MLELQLDYVKRYPFEGTWSYISTHRFQTIPLNRPGHTVQTLPSIPFKIFIDCTTAFANLRLTSNTAIAPVTHWALFQSQPSSWLQTPPILLYFLPFLLWPALQPWAS
jgi:hypothetical protein